MAEKDLSVQASRLVDRIARGDESAREPFEQTMRELLGPDGYAREQETLRRLGIKH